MKGMSWTRAAPFKEEKFHRTPSESIANNFTPTASNLKIRHLRRRTKSHCILCCLLNLVCCVVCVGVVCDVWCVVCVVWCVVCGV